MSSLALLWVCLASRNFDHYVVTSVVNVVTGLVNSVLILTSLDLDVLVLNGVQKLKWMGIVHLMPCFSDSCSVPGFLRQWLFKWFCEIIKEAFPFTKIFIWGCFSEQNLFVLLCLSHKIHKESI